MHRTKKKFRGLLLATTTATVIIALGAHPVLAQNAQPLQNVPQLQAPYKPSKPPFSQRHPRIYKAWRGFRFFCVATAPVLSWTSNLAGSYYFVSKGF